MREGSHINRLDNGEIWFYDKERSAWVDSRTNNLERKIRYQQEVRRCRSFLTIDADPAGLYLNGESQTQV